MLEQGIYPVIVVILVHSQRSYIESATALSHSETLSLSFHRPCPGTSTVTVGSVGSIHAKPTAFVAGRGHVPDINVHGLRQVRAEPSSSDVGAATTTGTGDWDDAEPKPIVSRMEKGPLSADA